MGGRRFGFESQSGSAKFKENKMETVNAYLKDGPLSGAMTKFPKDKLAPDLEVLVNDAVYKIIDGPILKVFMSGKDCDNLAITLEFVRME